MKPLTTLIPALGNKKTSCTIYINIFQAASSEIIPSRSTLKGAYYSPFVDWPGPLVAAVIVMSAKEEVRQSRRKSETISCQRWMVCNKSYIHVITIVILNQTVMFPYTEPSGFLA